MKYSKLFMMLMLGALVILFLGCSSGPTEKDIVGKWQVLNSQICGWNFSRI